MDACLYSVFDGVTESHLPTWTHVCRAYLTALLSVTYQHGRMSARAYLTALLSVTYQHGRMSVERI